MRTLIISFFILAIAGIGQLQAQKVITVNATNYDISDNLNLESVAYLLGESNDLEDFERKLNDPKLKISNLDLNSDGYIDYLRVLEARQGNISVVTIQSVLGRDIYQDVATIDVEVKNKRKVFVQVVGNEFIYGRNYIIEPIYIHQPVIYTYFWRPRHVVWVSPYHWRYYPKYYAFHSPRSVHVYHQHIYSNYHPRMKCHYVHVRKNNKAHALHAKIHRNDYASSRPDYSFEKRNSGIENHRILSSRRSARPNMETRPSNIQTQQDTRKVQINSQSTSVNNNRRTTRSSTTVRKPAQYIPRSRTESTLPVKTPVYCQSDTKRSEVIYKSKRVSEPQKSTRATSRSEVRRSSGNQKSAVERKNSRTVQRSNSSSSSNVDSKTSRRR